MYALSTVEAPDLEDRVFVVGQDDPLDRMDLDVVEAVLVADQHCCRPATTLTNLVFKMTIACSHLLKKSSPHY